MPSLLTGSTLSNLLRSASLNTLKCGCEATAGSPFQAAASSNAHGHHTYASQTAAHQAHHGQTNPPPTNKQTTYKNGLMSEKQRSTDNHTNTRHACRP